ncbi:MAG: hypothetical protein KQJ78_12490 [Deltaproteobacteria bacterium]|nr:hypothetical protein [Deltaproteobacteria bacterium]
MERFKEGIYQEIELPAPGGGRTAVDPAEAGGGARLYAVRWWDQWVELFQLDAELELTGRRERLTLFDFLSRFQHQPEMQEHFLQIMEEMGLSISASPPPATTVRPLAPLELESAPFAAAGAESPEAEAEWEDLPPVPAAPVPQREPTWWELAELAAESLFSRYPGPARS